MSVNEGRIRLLIFIVAYNAEKTIEQVLQRIPISLLDNYEVEVLVIDDASDDKTFENGNLVKTSNGVQFKLTILFNPVNQGYGGNQKIGFHYAIEQGFDVVALLHGDGQYAPECLPELVEPIAKGTADVVFGSRMIEQSGALKGGMPLYKYIGNKVLTWFQNRMLKTSLSEFHSGYRIYSTQVLKCVPFDLNTNLFHFDTEIIIQLVISGQRITELPIPTYYGDEICNVNGLKYAWDVFVATTKAWAQALCLVYDRKYDCQCSFPTNEQYERKIEFQSTHSAALETIRPNSRVLDLGCSSGYVGVELRKKGCLVTGIDLFPLAEESELDNFICHDLNAEALPVDLTNFDYVLMLDIIEHLLSPETFIEKLRESTKYAPDIKFIVSSGNIGFILTRLSLLIGQFNYGKRGILDLTHTRLFTFSTIKNLFTQAGFEILEVRGIPVPFPFIVKHKWLARVLLKANSFLIRLSKSLFSFQQFIIVKPYPSIAYLLQEAHIASEKRIKGKCEIIPEPKQ